MNICSKRLTQSLRRVTHTSAALTRCNGHQNRSLHAKPAYEGHIPLNWFETALLAVGSATMSLLDPRRADMIATLAEVTAGPVLPRLRDTMLAHPEGRQILKDRPRINTSTVDLEKLAQYPEGTLGKAYTSWLTRCNVSPDTRLQVRYINDPELAYVMQRYRECHDLYHCIFNLPVNFESELALKYFEFANLGLPMAGLAALGAPIRLNAQQRARHFSEAVPWALKCGGSATSMLTVYWEKRWEQKVDDIKKELGIWDPPEPRWGKKTTRSIPLEALSEK